MRKIKIIFLFGMAVVFLTAQNHPSWVINPPTSDTEMFAIGIASSKNKQLGINSASSLARAELSRIISVRVANQLVAMNEEVAGQVSSVSQTLSAQISETIMKGSKISQIYEDKTTKTPTYYVLISIELQDLQSSFSTLTDARFKELLSESSDVFSRIDTAAPVTKDSSVQHTPVEAKISLKEAEPKSGKRLPAWVSKFPTSTTHYIGIGQASQLKAAQDGAIAMIITQIRSKVQAEMKTFLQETNGTTQESYSQVIKMSLMENIEDVEYVDAFYSEVDKQYYAYYRLNIEEYRKKQEAKMILARDKALDMLTRADGNPDPALAFKQLLIGYVSIAPFISKDIRVNYKGKQIILVSELMAQLQWLMQDIHITPKQASFQATAINQEPFEVSFAVMHKGTAVKFVPFSFNVHNGFMNLLTRSDSDAQGNLKTVVNAAGGSGLKVLKATPDILSFVKDVVDEETAFLYLTMIAGLGLPSSEVSVVVRAPVFELVTEVHGEMNRYPERIAVAVSEFKNAFEKKAGAKFVDSKGDFIIQLDIVSNVTLSELSKQYFAKMLTTLTVVDVKSKEELYTYATPELKVGSNTEVKAIQAAVDKYRKEQNEFLVKEATKFFNLGN